MVLDANDVVVSIGFIVAGVGPPFLSQPQTPNFYNPATARPFTLNVYDVTTFGAFTEADALNGPIEDSIQFDPAPFHPNCAALPLAGNVTGTTSSGPVIDPASIPTDDRINFGFGDKSEGIVYGRSSIGIQVYEVRADSSGYLAVNVSPEDLPPCNPALTENQLLASSADGQFSIWLLTTCEYQVNMGPDADGKVHVIIWRGIPAIKESIVFSDFNMFDILDE